MAELSAPAETTADPCCGAERQATCCEPSAKADCCGHEEGCDCAASATTVQATDVREQVRERYAAVAEQVKVLREVARVLRPGGRFEVSDVIAESMDEATRVDMQAYTGCIVGALTEREFARALSDAGLGGIEIREIHRVHKQAASAIVRARKPDVQPA